VRFAVADSIGSRGAAALKALLTDAVNERLADARRRRAELVAEEGYMRSVLRRGTERAQSVAAETLTEVRTAMSMVY
jgi:tryptophanyl-tRNA synthetase